MLEVLGPPYLTGDGPGKGVAIGTESSRVARGLPGGLVQVGTCQKGQVLTFPRKKAQ